MSLPGVGHKGHLLLTKESTYGTSPGSAQDKYEVENFEYDANQSIIADPNINSSGASARSIVQGLQFVTGRFRIRIGFEGFENLWRFVLPTYSSAIVTGTTRDHTFKEGNALSGYSATFSEGDIPTGKGTLFTGMLCTGFRVNLEASQGASGIIVADIEFAAEDVVENSTVLTGSPTVANIIPVPFHFLMRTGTDIKDGSGLGDTSIFLRSFALSLEYPHDTRRGYLGSVWADSPVRDGPLSGRIDFEAQWDANNFVLMNKLLTNAPTAGGLKLTFQHPTIIEGTNKRELEFKASSPVAAGYHKSVPGPGVIMQRYSWALEFNAADASLLVVRTRNLKGALA